jgi:hypothetical protein
MQPTYWDSVFHSISFQFGKYPDGTFCAIFFEDSCYVFREKSHMGMQKMKFQ